MSQGFIVTVDRKTIYTYKKIAAPARLRRYLDEMDQDMQCGVQLGSNFVKQPSEHQQQQYVAMDLVQRLETNQDDSNHLNIISVLSAYLMNRNQELTEIRVTTHDGMSNMKFITKCNSK